MLRRAEQGHLQRSDTTLASARWPLSRDIQSLIEDRVQRLSPEYRELVDLAACLGDPFDPQLVAQLLGMEPLAVLRGLGRMARPGGLLQGRGAAFAFASPQIARGVRDLVPDPLRLAFHAAAAAHYETRFESQHQTEDLLDLLRHAIEAQDGERIERYWADACTRLEARQEVGRAADLLRDVLDRPGHLEGASRLRALLHLARPSKFGAASIDRASRLREAATLAAQLEDPASHARAMLGLADDAADRNDLEEGWAHTDRARSLAIQAGDQALELEVEKARANLARGRGDVEDARRRYETVILAAERLDLHASRPSPITAWVCSIARAPIPSTRARTSRKPSATRAITTIPSCS